MRETGGGEQQLVGLAPPVLRHGAHGEDGNGHHEDDGAAEQDIAEGGVAAEQVVGHEVDAYKKMRMAMNTYPTMEVK